MKASKPSAILAVMILVVAGCNPGEDGGTTTAVTTTAAVTTTTATPPQASDTILVVADYSPTVSDVGGLMYLLLHPRIDVIAITLPGTGEAGCELGIDVTLRILTLLDRTDLPVACDSEVPDDAKAWPAEFLRQSGNLRYLLPEPAVAAAASPAADLIVDVLADADRPVVLWAVAPLTNLARALESEPATASRIDRIVIMGGAVDVAGNVFDSAAEWNIYIDSAAASTVFTSGVPITLVPLDATNDLPVPAWYPLALERSAQSEAIVYLTRLARLFPILGGFWHFWDELAAVVIADPEIVATETARLTVIVGGAADGQTTRDPQGAEVTFATRVQNPNAFYAEFLGTLSGAPAPVGREPTAEETDYAAAIDEALESTNNAIDALFTDLSGAYDPERAPALLQAVADAGRDAADAISILLPPPALATAHAAFVDEFRAIVAALDGAVDRADEVDSFEELFAPIDVGNSPTACMMLRSELSLIGLETMLPC